MQVKYFHDKIGSSMNGTAGEVCYLTCSSSTSATSLLTLQRTRGQVEDSLHCSST